MDIRSRLNQGQIKHNFLQLDNKKGLRAQTITLATFRLVVLRIIQHINGQESGKS